MPHRRNLMIGLGAVLAFVPPLLRASTLAAPSYDDPDDMYAALSRQPHRSITLGGGTIDVTFADGAPGLDQDRVMAWVRESATAMMVYFGRYPVDHYRLLVIATPAAAVGHATTFGFRGSATRIHVGRYADDGAFARDWVLVHEMVHTALADLPRSALWLQEGNATYIEPIARAQAGQLSAEEVWRQSVVGMPTGESDAAGGGMDGTQAHNRLYWGGATFWLRAEIEIILKTSGRRTLRDAMRGMNRASGGNAVTWSPEHLLATGDAATGTDVLSTLYREFAQRPETTDLPTLFGKLGIISQPDGSVRFDDAAELAAVRRRITTDQ
jgi:predicted metalloprotease with PDZ domain